VRRISLQRLIRKLTDNAMMEATCSSRMHNGAIVARPLARAEMPGYRIKQLSPEEREVLATATAKDFGWRGFK
jgi:hypothetical protein